jgi:hypothetical protein
VYDLVIAGKIRMFKFIKSEYLEIANQMRLNRKTIRKITIFEKYSRNRGYLASVILAECGVTPVQ